MGWKKDTKVDVLAVSLYYCHLKVNESVSTSSYYITFVYGPPTQSNRHLLWSWIRDTAPTINLPWALVGDFNQIISVDDKLSSTGSNSGMIIFKEIMEHAGLDILNHQGPHFTCTNNRKGDHVCFERIDLAFCNSHWSSQYPCSYIQHMGIAASDHSPIVLHSKPLFRKSRGLKFEKYWYMFPECNRIIRDSWSNSARGSPMFSFTASLYQLFQPYTLGIPVTLVTSP